MARKPENAEEAHTDIGSGCETAHRHEPRGCKAVPLAHVLCLNMFQRKISIFFFLFLMLQKEYN